MRSGIAHALLNQPPDSGRFIVGCIVRGFHYAARSVWKDFHSNALSARRLEHRDCLLDAAVMLACVHRASSGFTTGSLLRAGVASARSTVQPSRRRVCTVVTFSPSSRAHALIGCDRP